MVMPAHLVAQWLAVPTEARQQGFLAKHLHTATLLAL